MCSIIIKFLRDDSDGLLGRIDEVGVEGLLDPAAFARMVSRDVLGDFEAALMVRREFRKEELDFAICVIKSCRRLSERREVNDLGVPTGVVGPVSVVHSWFSAGWSDDSAELLVIRSFRLDRRRIS